MIVSGNEEYIVRGNTVLAPQFEPETHEKKSIKKRNKSNKAPKRNRNRVKIIRNIVAGFIVGVTLILRYSYIYDMQDKLNNIDNAIVKTNKTNENLKVQLVKYNNLQWIEKEATEKLKMIKPSKQDIIYCDLDKRIFGDVKKEDKIKETKENIFKSWFSKLF